MLYFIVQIFKLNTIFDLILSILAKLYIKAILQLKSIIIKSSYFCKKSSNSTISF